MFQLYGFQVIPAQTKHICSPLNSRQPSLLSAFPGVYAGLELCRFLFGLWDRKHGFQVFFHPCGLRKVSVRKTRAETFKAYRGLRNSRYLRSNAEFVEAHNRTVHPVDNDDCCANVPGCLKDTVPPLDSKMIFQSHLICIAQDSKSFSFHL